MSKQAYIIRNQQQHYLDAQGQWAGPDSGEVPFFSPHRDVALNRLFELTLADVALRGEVQACPLDARGRPLLQETAAASPIRTEATAVEDSAG